MKIVSKVMVCDTPNRNGRVYPLEIIEKSVEEINQKIKNGYMPLMGTLSDLSQSRDFYQYVSLKDASHLISKLYMDGSTMCMEGEILATPNGRIAERIGVENLGCELVGIGEVDASTNTVTNFNLLGIDLLPKEQCAWEDSEIVELKN